VGEAPEVPGEAVEWVEQFQVRGLGGTVCVPNAVHRLNIGVELPVMRSSARNAAPRCGKHESRLQEHLQYRVKGVSNGTGNGACG
jgi:hypothetical protein